MPHLGSINDRPIETLGVAANRWEFTILAKHRDAMNNERWTEITLPAEIVDKLNAHIVKWSHTIPDDPGAFNYQEQIT